MIGLPSRRAAAGAPPTWNALAVPRRGAARFHAACVRHSDRRRLPQPVQRAGSRGPAASDAVACRSPGGRVGRWGGGHRRQGVASVVRRCGVAIPAASGASVRRRGASGIGTGTGGGQIERDCGSAGVIGDAGAEGADHDGGRDAHTAPTVTAAGTTTCRH